MSSHPSMLFYCNLQKKPTKSFVVFGIYCKFAENSE